MIVFNILAWHTITNVLRQSCAAHKNKLVCLTFNFNLYWNESISNKKSGFDTSLWTRPWYKLISQKIKNWKSSFQECSVDAEVKLGSVGSGAYISYNLGCKQRTVIDFFNFVYLLLRCFVFAYIKKRGYIICYNCYVRNAFLNVSSSGTFIAEYLKAKDVYI